MQRRAVTQGRYAHFLDQVEVGAPVAVVSALFHFILAQLAAMYGRNAAFNAGGKDESGKHGDLERTPTSGQTALKSTSFRPDRCFG